MNRSTNPEMNLSFHSTPVSPTRSWSARLRTLVLGLGLLTALAASASQEQLAASIRATRDEVTATRDQLQATVTALETLVSQKEGSMKPAYDAFVREVERTQEKAALTTSRSAKMQSEAKAHFGAWQKEIDGISSASLRKKGQKRLDSVQKGYGKASGSLGRAATSFEPYLSDLADIRKILANDLTPGGVRSIRRTVSQAKFDLGSIRSHINATIEELDKMAKSLTSSAGSK